MNQDERKKFWDVLLTMHDAAPEHIQQLQKTIIIPNTLCRFRAVNENSLVQLQENKLYFSTSDYYDDPFDTYFYLDYDAIDRQIDPADAAQPSGDHPQGACQGRSGDRAVRRAAPPAAQRDRAQAGGRDRRYSAGSLHLLEEVSIQASCLP